MQVFFPSLLKLPFLRGHNNFSLTNYDVKTKGLATPLGIHAQWEVITQHSLLRAKAIGTSQLHRNNRLNTGLCSWCRIKRNWMWFCCIYANQGQLLPSLPSPLVWILSLQFCASSEIGLCYCFPLCSAHPYWTCWAISTDSVLFWFYFLFLSRWVERPVFNEKRWALC